MNASQAKPIAMALVSVWRSWSDGNEDASDDALRMLCQLVRDSVDLTQVDGTIAAPLGYFVSAYLDGYNPEDLTYDQMMESMEVSLKL